VFRPKLEQLALLNFGTFGTKSSKGRDSAGSGENGTARTETLGHLEHERVKYVVQGFRPIGEQSALLNLGQLGRKVPTGPKMEQLRGFRPIRDQSALLNLGQLGRKVPTCPKMEQLQGFRPRGTERTFELGT
ncbi:hypothetical protein KI387_037983, partial [Taxus chinensis]